MLENVSAIDLIYGNGATQTAQEEGGEGGSDNSAQTQQQENNPQEGGNQQDPKPDKEQIESQEDNAGSEPEETDGEENSNEDSQEVDLFENLSKTLGIEVEGEFEDSEEGLANYVKAASTKMAQIGLAEAFQQFPDVHEFYEFRKNGGDPSKYFELNKAFTDYENIEINSDDVGTQRQVVKTLLKKQGFDDNAIGEILTEYSENNILEKMAQKALGVLKEASKKEKDIMLENQRKQKEAEQEEAKKLWNQVGDIIKAGKIKSIIIPETEKKGFYEWMAKPIDNKGTTKRMQDKASMDIETSLLLEYLIYKNADLSKLVVNRQKTQQARSLSSRFKQKSVSGRMGSTKNTGRPAQLPSLENFL